MKTKFLNPLLLFLSSTLCASQLSWVDEQVEAIKPPRKGVEILKMKDPFIFLQKNKPETTKEAKNPVTETIVAPKETSITDKEKDKNKIFVLSAIINTSALIDGIWYKKDDKIDDYTIIDITKTTATLKKQDKMVVISTSTKTPSIKFKNK